MHFTIGLVIGIALGIGAGWLLFAPDAEDARHTIESVEHEIEEDVELIDEALHEAKTKGPK